MYILEDSDISFGSCTFSNNQASEKGGTMYISRITSSKKKDYWNTISLINSEITGSSSMDSGGAIYLSHDLVYLDIEGCTISNTTS
jgi:hypothetical protein